MSILFTGSGLFKAGVQTFARSLTALVAVIVLFVLQSPASGQSKVHETVYGRANQQIEGMVRESLSLEIVLPNAKRYKLDAFVTRPDRAGQFPVALITHGSEGNEDDKLIEPNKFSGAAIAFARHGYASVVVLRRGYGRSGGKIDYKNDTCKKPHHLKAGEIARGDLLAALEAIRKTEWAAPDKAVLLGTSTGGFSVLAASALNPAGVQAVINFSGGRGAKDGGGICSRKSLLAAVAAFGKTARIPGLWIYSANDSFFPPDLAKDMLGRYQAGGGVAEFFPAPPFKDNGHFLLASSPEDFWWPQVGPFLKKQGLPSDETIKLADPQLPFPSQLNGKGVQAFVDYRTTKSYEKAFAYSPDGAWGWVTSIRTQWEAAKEALATCQEYVLDGEETCILYAVGDKLVMSLIQP